MSFESEVVSAVGICTLRQVDALYAAPKYFGEGVALEAFVATGITVSYAVLHQPPTATQKRYWSDSRSPNPSPNFQTSNR
ncbi:hypothetical protein PRNP1_011229 [Phytophthora ramorum]